MPLRPIPQLLLLLLWQTTALAASVYHCPDPSGVPAFQATPCSDGGPIELGQPAAYWSAPRPGEQKLLEQLKPSRVLPSTPAGAGRRAEAEARTCFKKQKAIERISARLRRGYKASEGERLRRQRDEYEEYLQRFCR